MPGHYPFGVRVYPSGEDFDERLKAMKAFCVFVIGYEFETITLTDRLTGKTYISFQFSTAEQAAVFRETWGVSD